MINAKRCFTALVIALCSVFFLAATPARAAVTPASGYTAQSLAAANPAPFNWISSIATYGNYIIYAATDKKVYGYDTTTGASTLISDTSALSDPFSAVFGFIVAPNGALYFHENSFPTTQIGMINLGAAWPVPYLMLETNCLGSIYSIARNPWDGSIWFASSDFTTHQMYLYRINDAYDGATLKGTGFAAPHGGGNGPLVFTSPTRVLYGESVWPVAPATVGTGYFHLVDTVTGAIVTADYLTFAGGLSAAVPGKIGRVYAASGDGKTVYELAGTTVRTVGTSTLPIQGLSLSDTGFIVAEQDGTTGQTSFSSLTPTDDVRPKTLAPAANPANFGWNASIGYYSDIIFYAGADKKIYGYNKTNAAVSLVCDTSALSDPWSAVFGFMATKNGWLYFHANSFPTTTIYRIKITNAWPITDIKTLNTGCLGSIYSFCQNPWDDSVWMASSDFVTNDMFLYAVASDFSAVTLTTAFAAPHGGGNGPIIFQDEDTLLYGESVWAGNGYFHQIELSDKSVIPDVLTFTGGLVGASYGRNMEIYAASGDGLNVYKITGNNIDSIAVTPSSAQSLIYDGWYHWVSVMDGTGAVSFYRIGAEPVSNPSTVEPLDTSSGCFVNTVNGSSARAGRVMFVVFGLAALALALFGAFSGKKRIS